MSEEVIYLWNGGRKTGRRVRNASGRLSRFIGHSKVTCPKCGGHGVNVRSGLPCIRCMGDGTVPAPKKRKKNPTGITFSGAYFRPVRKRGASRRPRFTRIWRGRSRAVFARHVPRGWGAVAKRLTNGRRRSRSRK